MEEVLLASKFVWRQIKLLTSHIIMRVKLFQIRSNSLYSNNYFDFSIRLLWLASVQLNERNYVSQIFTNISFETVGICDYKTVKVQSGDDSSFSKDFVLPPD